MNSNQYYLRDLNNFKKAGVKKVELICPGECKCCTDIKGKQIPIENIKELPMAECEYNNCVGKYTAVIEFDF